MADGVDRITPTFWGLFTMGGFVVAFLFPVLIVMNSLAYSLRIVPWEAVQYGPALGWLHGDPAAAFLGPASWAAPWLPKLFLVLVIGGALFHGLHRFKYVMYDFGLHGAKRLLDPIMYGIAAVGTAAAVFLAFSFP